MKVLIIDNYDSFTYNLYQYVGEILQSKNEQFVLDVVRNDELTVGDIRDRGYDKIIISPGPGNPAEKAYFGVCGEVLTTISKTVPTLGVCLGMQGMAHFYGGTVVRATVPMHGKTSAITHDGKGVFTGLPQELSVMRYHSLVIAEESLPKEFEISAFVVRHSGVDAIESKEIMGIRHKKYPIEGVQFHPESFVTDAGKKMLENFLRIQ